MVDINELFQSLLALGCWVWGMPMRQYVVWRQMYVENIPNKICTWFCVTCFVVIAVFMWFLYPCASMLGHCRWGNHKTAAMPALKDISNIDLCLSITKHIKTRSVCVFCGTSISCNHQYLLLMGIISTNLKLFWSKYQNPQDIKFGIWCTCALWDRLYTTDSRKWLRKLIVSHTYWWFE